MYYNIVDGPLTWNVVGMGPQSRFLLMETTRGGVAIKTCPLLSLFLIHYD